MVGRDSRDPDLVELVAVLVEDVELLGLAVCEHVHEPVLERGEALEQELLGEVRGVEAVVDPHRVLPAEEQAEPVQPHHVVGVRVAQEELVGQGVAARELVARYARQRREPAAKRAHPLYLTFFLAELLQVNICPCESVLRVSSAGEESGEDGKLYVEELLLGLLVRQQDAALGRPKGEKYHMRPSTTGTAFSRLLLSRETQATHSEMH